MNPVLSIIFAVVWLGIGVAVMIWIQKDNEFRESEMAAFLAYGSIILWPITGILWYYLRPQHQYDDLAAKKSHQDFKNFMKTRKAKDQDILGRLDERTRPDKPLEIQDAFDAYRDHHLEELIAQGAWQDAMRTANDMLRFAREQQEEARVAAYERYIKDIKAKRLEELG